MTEDWSFREVNNWRSRGTSDRERASSGSPVRVCQMLTPGHTGTCQRSIMKLSFSCYLQAGLVASTKKPRLALVSLVTRIIRKGRWVIVAVHVLVTGRDVSCWQTHRAQT